MRHKRIVDIRKPNEQVYKFIDSKAILCPFYSLHFTSNFSIHCLRSNIKSNNFVALQCIVRLSALIPHNNPQREDEESW